MGLEKTKVLKRQSYVAEWCKKKEFQNDERFYSAFVDLMKVLNKCQLDRTFQNYGKYWHNNRIVIDYNWYA